jgi:hypothetical protein
LPRGGRHETQLHNYGSSAFAVTTLFKRVPLRYAILFLLTAVTAVATLCLHGSAWWIDSLGPNLCAGFLGSLITVALVDHAVADRDRKIERIAAAEAGRPVRRLLHEFGAMLKAAQISRPIPAPTTLSELFCREQLSNLDWFDINAQSSDLATPWYLRASTEFRANRDVLTQVMAKYSTALRLELIEAIDDVCSDMFLRIVGDLQTLAVGQVPVGVIRPGLNGTEDIRWAFTQKLLRLSDVLGNILQGLIAVPWSYTRDDVAPAFGSARLAALPPPMLVVIEPPVIVN